MREYWGVVYLKKNSFYAQSLIFIIKIILKVKHIFTTKIKYSLESAYYILCLHTTSCFLIASLILWSPIGQITPSCLPLHVKPVNLRRYLGSF